MLIRLQRGAVAGLFAGAVMAMFMMFWSLGTDRGFWEVPGYIGHFFFRDADITSGGQVAFGLFMHMAISMGLGVAIAWVLPFDSKVVGLVWGTLAGLAIWAIMHYYVLEVFDEVAFDGIAKGPFAFAHVLFGGMVGYMTPTPMTQEMIEHRRMHEAA